MQLIKVLKKIAAAGCSVLFTIHQPSSDVFNSFDRLILLNKGMVMYQGPVERVPDFFAAHNHPMPKNYNPADWIMEIAQQYSQEQLLKEGFFSKDERKLEPALTPTQSQLMDSLGISTHEDISDDEWKHVGFLSEVALLFKRECIHNTRNKKGVGARFAFTTFLSTLVGCIFFQVGAPTEDGSIDPAASQTWFVYCLSDIALSNHDVAFFIVHTEIKQPLWCDGHDSHDEHVWNSNAHTTLLS